MIMKTQTLVALAFASFLLTGCSSMNLFKDSPESAPPVNDLAPEDDSAPLASASKGLSVSEINKALSGKSWKWKGPNNAGVTLFANDGSSLVEVTGKGTTTGKWMAKNGQLCEKFEPAPFLPKGVPMTCQPITGGGGTYKVGQATFTLAQ
jgi:Protein of unknown function (DUF995)